MSIVPSESYKRQREIETGNAWRLWTYLCWRRHTVTGQCNPSQQTIANDTGIEYTRVSVAKAELIAKHWVTWTKKGGFILLVGVKDFERARNKKLAEIAREERRKFAKRKVTDPNFAERKVSGDLPGETQTPTLPNANSHFKGYERVVEPEKAVVVAGPVANAATTTMTTTTSSRPDKDAWKQEPADEAFCQELVHRALFSDGVVEQAWKELMFKVIQRGPGAIATKGELWAFCFQKQKTGILPGVLGPTGLVGADNARTQTSAPQSSGQVEVYCEFDSSQFEKCPQCFGTGMEVVAGKGARKCSNRRSRMVAGG